MPFISACRRHSLIAVIGALFLGFSLLGIDDFGMTWDEPETFAAAAANVKLLRQSEGTPGSPRGGRFTNSVDDVAGSAALGRRAFPDSYHRLPGYYFVFDTLRGLFVSLVIAFEPEFDRIHAHHLFNILLSTSCVVLLYFVVFAISEETRVSAFAALTIALLPKFVGHSQNNPKDLPAIFVYLLTAFLLVRATLVPQSRKFIFVALALGISLTTRVISIFLVEILAVWLALRWPRRAVALWKQYAFAIGGGGLTAFVFWPWLWNHPIEKLQVIIQRLSTWQPFSVLYLGKIWDWSELPWHYFSVHLVASLPLPFLGLLLFAPLALLRWRGENVRKCDAVWLGFVWVGLLLIVEPTSPRQYDGMRHFLVILPGIAILIAAGAEYLVERAAQSAGTGKWTILPKRVLIDAVVAGCFAMALIELAFIHPYETAYLNQVADWLAGQNSEDWLEVEYWGNAYKEGAQWLNRHAEPDAEVCVPFGDHIARVYSNRTVRSSCTLADYQGGTRPRYLMFITRKALYERSPYAPLLDYVQSESEPVFTIRRQHATLLRIYRSPP